MIRNLPVLLIFLVLAGCGRDIEPGLQTTAQPVVKGVTLAVVTLGGVADGDAYVGTVESLDRAVIAARTEGIVTRVAVRAGEEVGAGMLLLEISGNQGGDRLKVADAVVQEARKRLAAARARADLARKTSERYRRLFEKEAVTPQEMDRVSAEMEEALQGLAAAEAAVVGAESGRSAARSVVGYDRVTAPYSAQVVRREVEEGSTVMPGMPLLVLDRRGTRVVRAEIPESRAGKVHLGEEVRIEIPSLRQSFPGKISEVQSAADPQSRSFRVKAELPPGTDLPTGLFARLLFPAAERQLLLVPAAAVVERGQLTGVYVVRHGVMSYRLIKTGREIDGRIEVLAGLQPGETVVVGGVEKARSGARVEG